MKNVVPLLYTMDDNYSMQAGVSLYSLFENNKEHQFCLYVISDNISEENKSKLIRLCQKYGNEIYIFEMPDLDTFCGENLAVSQWAKSAYCRLFLTELMPKDIDRLLYFDPDTIIVDKIDGLIETLFSPELTNYYVAASIDIDLWNKRYKGFKKTEQYYNTGVLLINLKKWREDNVFNTFLSEIERREGGALDVDQCYINCVFINRILKLPAEYNVMPSMYLGYKEYRKKFSKEELYSEEEIEYAVKNPVIVHFCRCGCSIRPWFRNSNHPMKEEWDKYFERTEWRDTVLKEQVCDISNDNILNYLKGMILYTAIKIPFMRQIICKRLHGFYPKLFRE